MEWGEFLTRGTAQVATACYLLRVLLDVAGWDSESWNRRKRGFWTLGCLVLWLHIAAAFAFVHNWSHADALRTTAEQTEAVTGWSWGGGVYINYLFAVFWLADVSSWWRRGADFPQNSRTRYWITHAVFGFIFFNATVVFGPIFWRYVGAGFLVVCLLVYSRCRNRGSDAL